MKQLILKPIRFYQKYLSFGNHCRFYPSCSEYSYQAIEKYGIISGSCKALKRIVRCNPWNKGGNDPLK